MILNLKTFNGFLKFKHCKLGSFEDTLDLITECCYFGSVELKDASYTIPIHKNYQKYLKLFWKEKYYQYVVLTKLFSPALRGQRTHFPPTWSALKSNLWDYNKKFLTFIGFCKVLLGNVKVKMLLISWHLLVFLCMCPSPAHPLTPSFFGKRKVLRLYISGPSFIYVWFAVPKFSKSKCFYSSRELNFRLLLGCFFSINPPNAPPALAEVHHKIYLQQ